MGCNHKTGKFNCPLHKSCVQVDSEQELSMDKLYDFERRKCSMYKNNGAILYKKIEMFDTIGKQGKFDRYILIVSPDKVIVDTEPVLQSVIGKEFSWLYDMYKERGIRFSIICEQDHTGMPERGNYWGKPAFIKLMEKFELNVNK